MIDFYIRFNTEKQGFESVTTSTVFEKYKKYICIEKKLNTSQVYYYSNTFDQSEFEKSYLETNEDLFFLFGSVNFRNAINSGNNLNVPVEEVYKIVSKNKDFYKLIKGNFVCILFNKVNLSIEIINSPWGVIPVNYWVKNGIVQISSNLTFILKQIEKPVLNKTSLIQVSLFDTILGSNTLVEGIKQLQYGEIISIVNNKVISSKYYTHSLLLGHPKKRKESLYSIIENLKQNIQILPLEKPFLFGLTGGYDCRLNLGLLPKDKYNKLIAYTYGMPISQEFKIAEEIAKRYGLKYKKILLEDEFEKDYIRNADEVLFLGDGFTPFMRVNYYYAHKHLSAYARECITGMYGSEFIKPMHVMADSVSINPETVSAFFSLKPIDSIAEYFNNTKKSAVRYYNEEIYSNASLEETLEIIKNNYIVGKENLSKEERIFNFYLNEGMRKFFMEILRVDRMFVNHHLPYLDIDFLEVLLNSEYAGVYNNIFNESIIKRRKGQMLYVDVLDRVKPDLNNIPVDRGYKPKHMKNLAGWTYVTAGYFLGKKMRHFLKGNTTFNTKKWRGMVYNSNVETLKSSNSIFNDMLYKGFNSGYYLKNEHVFGKHYSLKKWLDSNGLLY